MDRASLFSGTGISHGHARRWRDSIYSGMVCQSLLEPRSSSLTPHLCKVPLTQLLPNDIGAAAAYEMYRTWKYNSFLYEPLSADRGQQREGLIGMAIAEGMLRRTAGGSSF